MVKRSTEELEKMLTETSEKKIAIDEEALSFTSLSLGSRNPPQIEVLTHYMRDIIQLYENAKSVIKEDYEKRRKLLDKELIYSEFSVRTGNCLKINGITTVRDLVSNIKSEEDFFKYKNVGRNSFAEIKDFLDKNDLHLGMDINEYLGQE